MVYKNPIPQVAPANKFKLIVSFTFEKDCLTKEDAAEGIANTILNAIKENNGKIPVSWIDYAE